MTKTILRAILTLALTLVPGLAVASTLDTPNFTVKITPECAEGTIGCDKVIYEGTNKKTKQSIKLSGKELVHMCADRVTPCRALGYEFRNGKYVYFVTAYGRLIVSEGKKTIINELGYFR